MLYASTATMQETAGIRVALGGAPRCAREERRERREESRRGEKILVDDGANWL